MSVRHLTNYYVTMTTLLLLGDFNSPHVEPYMKDFCETYNLENLIKEPTCFKNTINPSSIDVMLTNTKNSFQDAMTIETGLSDHHRMTTSILKIFFKEGICKNKIPFL